MIRQAKTSTFVGRSAELSTLIGLLVLGMAAEAPWLRRIVQAVLPTPGGDGLTFVRLGRDIFVGTARRVQAEALVALGQVDRAKRVMEAAIDALNNAGSLSAAKDRLIQCLP